MVALGACGDDARNAQRSDARDAPCDSTRAVRLALDSLARLDSFPSAVLRFQRDSNGLRIVTWPDRAAGATIVDGMAIVQLTPTCRITSLVQTDSA